MPPKRTQSAPNVCPQRAVQLLYCAVAKYEAVLSVEPDLVPALHAAANACLDLVALLPPDSLNRQLAYQVRGFSSNKPWSLEPLGG